VSNQYISNDFFNRCVSAWNSLPSVNVNSKYVAALKRALVSFDLFIFLNYAYYYCNLTIVVPNFD